ncbi:hypothetical protein J8273_3636 [Carpediemonas membranifera]|uniref:Uncharacterized protein n=1 Tax=Carpediemonas membranifera TaxID=201153 RepID=A0A8J6B7E4_9EUKA|nr:hypothetical protein J8273_3636 [Carpediemonas membranifera]|eukprot:KAG9394664.1 hypothetical protein J8273_3636 [Carpediemonas membranifera]
MKQANRHPASPHRQRPPQVNPWKLRNTGAKATKLLNAGYKKSEVCRILGINEDYYDTMMDPKGRNKRNKMLRRANKLSQQSRSVVFNPDTSVRLPKTKSAQNLSLSAVSSLSELQTMSASMTSLPNTVDQSFEVQLKELRIVRQHGYIDRPRSHRRRRRKQRGPVRRLMRWMRSFFRLIP